MVKVSAVSWGQYLEQESKTCHDPARINADLLIRSGDFLFSRANTIELIGACVIVDAVELNIMLSDKILRLGVVSGVEKWLLFVLRSAFGRSEIERLATGNQDSMRNTGQARIKSIRIPLPPTDELVQAILGTESLLSLSEAVELELETNHRKSISLKQAVLTKVFSGH